MDENYLITVITNQNIDGDEEVIEMTTNASLEGKDNDYYISYLDGDEDLGDCKTTLHVEDGRCITISRQGALNSHMIIEKNVRHISHHVTRFGSFSMGISAMEIDSKIRNNGGTLNFKYSTDIDMRPVGEIEFNITLSKKNMYHNS